MPGTAEEFGPSSPPDFTAELNAVAVVDGDCETAAPLLPKVPPPPTLSSKLWSFFLEYNLPLGPVVYSSVRKPFRTVVGFVFVLAVSIVFPAPGSYLSDIEVGGIGLVQSLFVCVVFLISGLCFNTADIKGAIHAFQGVIFGVLSILILTPLFGFVVMEVDFIPRSFRVGLSVFSASPTTLTIGVALLEQAGGNAALGLLLVILSNVFGILTVPFAVRWTVGSSSNASIDANDLLIKLMVTILIPLAIGKALLEFSADVKDFVKSNKVLMGLLKNFTCVAIVWLSSSHSRDALVEQRIADIGSILLLCICLHVSFLIFNSVCCWLIRVKGKELMAVVIMASQKTFPVTIAVISYLDPEKVGDLGLLTIPCIIAHLTQLFIDSALLSKWNYKDELEI